jgi:hypothetical protein
MDSDNTYSQATKLATDSLVSERCPPSHSQQSIPRGGGWAHFDSVEALRYKPGSIPDGVIAIFNGLILPAALRPWGDSTSYKNEYHEYFLDGVKTAGA